MNNNSAFEAKRNYQFYNRTVTIKQLVLDGIGFLAMCGSLLGLAILASA